MNLVRLGAIAATVMSLSSVAALAAPLVHLSTHGYVVHSSSSGLRLEEFSSSVAPHSGDLIEWKVVAKNDGRDVARRLVTNLPIPASTEYVAGTATGSPGVVVAFSVDGGKSFSPKPMRVVHTPQGDVTKPADPASYTTVRWTDESDLSSNASAAFSYEAKVK